MYLIINEDNEIVASEEEFEDACGKATRLDQSEGGDYYVAEVIWSTERDETLTAIAA